jgi:tetratricopeptide (TPR) repeat protein
VENHAVPRKVCFAWRAGLLAGAVAVLPAATATSTADRVDRLAALDYAFRFASAIATDPKDKAKAQELVLSEYAVAGAFENAIRLSGAVEGWRRGVIYADLAAALAREGRADEARALVGRAEAVRRTVTGWQNPRVSAHVAQAMAALGESDKARAIASDLSEADPVQYAGRAAFTEAIAIATDGDFRKALGQLATLQGDNDLDVSIWRTTGYLTLSRRSSAARNHRLEALDAARDSAAGLPPTLRLQALIEISEVSASLGRRSAAKKDLAAAAAILDDLEGGHSERLPLLIDLARAWAKSGEEARGGVLLAEADGLVEGALSIDRPGLLARIASAYRQVPDDVMARRHDERALDAAAALPLSRPRALALSAICRQMGRDGVALDGRRRSRLDALLAGLGEPW